MKKILATLIVLSIFSCKKPKDQLFKDDKKHLQKAVIIFSVGEASIESDNGSEKAKIGSIVSENDKIITKDKSKVDIQLPNESIIRISEKTKIDFASFKDENGKRDTQLALASGKIFVKINNKLGKDDRFNVMTPTAIAGVRGTSFVVETGSKDTIKVIEGEVAVKKDDIEEIDLKADSGITLNGLIVEDNKPSINEQKEIVSLVTIKEEKIREVIEISENPETQTEKLKKVEEEITIEQENNKKQFVKELIEEPKKLENNKDIAVYYERLEKIIMTDNSVMIGAIINQDGDLLIIHTNDGIKRINQDKIREVIYDFDKKYK